MINHTSHAWLMRLFTPTCLLVLSFAFLQAAPETVVWRLDNTAKIGGVVPEVLGAPRIVREADGVAMYFNGAGDGLMMPLNPVAGWPQFTVEVLLRPDVDGPEEQRFLHFQGDDGARGLIELRLSERQWCLDTFLFAEHDGRVAKRTLIDRARLHSAGAWHWVALRYDGRQMSHYVDGVKELEGELVVPPLRPGRTTVGVRLNKIFWFKGAIREVRFHPAALAPESLQRPQ